MSDSTSLPRQASRESERWFEATFEQAAVGMAHFDIKGNWLHVNQQVCAILGYSHDELTEKNRQEITHPDDFATEQACLKDIVAGNADSYTLEVRYLQKSGDTVWVNLSVSLVAATDKAPAFFIAVMQNIQNRKESEQALIESEQRWHNLLENLPDIVYQYSTKRGILYVAPKVESFFGIPPQDLDSPLVLWPDRVHPDDRHLFDQARDDLWKGKPFTIEYRARDKDGNWRWLCNRTISRKVDTDEIIIEGLSVDITESKMREAALSANEENYRELTRSIPGAIFIYELHPDGTDSVRNMSEGCRDIWEISAEEARTNVSCLWEMILPGDAEGLLNSIQTSADTLTFWSHEWRIQTPSGKLKWLSGTGKPIRKPNGDVIWHSVVIDVTQERLAKIALESFFEQNMNLNIIVKSDGTILRANSLWEEALGYSRRELEGHNFIEFVHPDDRVQTARESRKLIRCGHGSAIFENRYRHKNGHYRMLSWSAVISQHEGIIYGIARDITEQRAAEKKLLQASTYFKSTDEGIMLTDMDTHIVDVNDAFCRITGYDRDEVIGRKPGFLRSGRHQKQFYEAMWRSINETGSWRGEIWNRRKSGEIYPELLTISTVKTDDSRPSGYVGAFSDITDLKAHQDRLDYLANHDALTDMPNRLLLNSRLEQAIKRALRMGKSLAVMFIDIDRFKHINESLGHTAGDQVLVQLGQRLQSQLRAYDTVARMSGDEFVILLEDIGKPESAAQIARNLMSCFERPFYINEMDITVTASMGLSLCPQDSKDPAVLLANADAAMYKAKEEGRNTFLFYSSELTSQAFEYVLLKSALKKALDKDELFLVYQPQILLEDESLIGMEALLRWKHSELGMISPARFIPIAEQNGLIRQIGQWVLEKACAQGQKWLELGLPVGRIAVNVSGPQFHADNFVEEVRLALDASGLPATHLELEVTESFFVQQTDTIIAKLETLRGLGIKISVDDFGTGYSSLSYLKKLPIDKLKIDQSFLHGIPEERDNVAITESIIALGQALNLSVIAEGVETQEQADFLKQYAKLEAQGYLFSMPLEVADIEQFMRQASGH